MQQCKLTKLYLIDTSCSCTKWTSAYVCRQPDLYLQDGTAYCCTSSAESAKQRQPQHSVTVIVSFLATLVMSAGSQVIFKVRRPFYFINSSIFVEDGEGSTIGEVQQRWHLWQRNYDLYIDRKQYATINSGLWAWEFLLKDKDGGKTAWYSLTGVKLHVYGVINSMHKATWECMWQPLSQ